MQTNITKKNLKSLNSHFELNHFVQAFIPAHICRGKLSTPYRDRLEEKPSLTPLCAILRYS